MKICTPLQRLDVNTAVTTDNKEFAMPVYDSFYHHNSKYGCRCQEIIFLMIRPRK